MTMEEWVKLRQMQQQRRTKAPKITKDGKYYYETKELEIIPGLHAQIHN